ncbi:lipopolysaccharide assembly protein LapB [Candidatus Pandoraea novymonadis]|uniref:Lipopolysaccharide assembly protein B n=1 Tax=Candidatus Pandoraea novymonadis TaxID=1808959 RepID=A0ABX5FFI0_9BURK|nr:lipopolysaccharide assembly protein LapB [Candidatus Pandoraea novymonadis]PSB92233.1 Lipopolysaccharide assembly protein B [Candidatus Pandoraea novymonadis]
MEFEGWWLLAIPIIFGMGWVAARFDLRTLLSESRSLPSSYFRGLNFLLNEQPDKAIDAFIEVAKLAPETIELHFALGSLFRRRGETERAIRLHQNLLSREDLLPNDQAHALFELGHDFLKAGLLDRAEEAFSRLHIGNFSKAAQQSVLTIYQMEKEWQKAIDVAQQLTKQDFSISYRKEIAQFHCELAQEARQRKDMSTVAHELATALQVNPTNIRAILQQGDFLLSMGDAEGALRTLSHIEQQNPIYLGLAAKRMIQAYEALGRISEGIAVLRAALFRHPSDDLLEILYEKTKVLYGEAAALALIRESMQLVPSEKGMMKLLESHSLESTGGEFQSDLQLMSQLVCQRTKLLPRYVCSYCGFRARLFYWQCPSCNFWETYTPRRSSITASF